MTKFTQKKLLDFQDQGFGLGPLEREAMRHWLTQALEEAQKKGMRMGRYKVYEQAFNKGNDDYEAGYKDGQAAQREADAKVAEDHVEWAIKTEEYGGTAKECAKVIAAAIRNQQPKQCSVCHETPEPGYLCKECHGGGKDRRNEV